MKQIRIIFIGAVEFSAATLNSIISNGLNVVGIITKKKSDFNADFFDLSSVALEHGIPFIHVSNINDPENINWIKSLNPDVIYCFGWSNLIKQDILSAAPLGVIGYHPALLPFNRGRHPIIWALALGLKETGSSFFFMDKGADTGDIISQRKIEISKEDDARTLYNKITNNSLAQIKEFTLQLQEGNYQRIKQPAQGNNWRKRSKNDGRIDFRMTAVWIVNLVKALTKPYVGAHVEFNDSDHKIWAAEEGANAPVNLEPGLVLDIVDNKIRVKCAEGSVWLNKHDFTCMPKIGDYLL